MLRKVSYNYIFFKLVSFCSDTNNNSRLDSVTILEHESVKRELESYKIQVQALQSQLEEQTRLYKEQTDALMEDRSIRQQETEAQRERDQEKIQVISEKSEFFCLNLLINLVIFCRSTLTSIIIWKINSFLDLRRNFSPQAE